MFAKSEDQILNFLDVVIFQLKKLTVITVAVGNNQV
jgi:hypothetical protein